MYETLVYVILFMSTNGLSLFHHPSNLYTSIYIEGCSITNNKVRKAAYQLKGYKILRPNPKRCCLFLEIKVLPLSQQSLLAIHRLPRSIRIRYCDMCRSVHYIGRPQTSKPNIPRDTPILDWLPPTPCRNAVVCRNAIVKP